MERARALIVAAGSGSRMGGGLPKQYRPLAGRPVLAWTLEPFLAHDGIESVTVVISGEHRALYDASVSSHPKLAPPASGANSRGESVLAGLRAMAEAGGGGGRVLVHDGARPAITSSLLGALLSLDPPCVPVVAVPDALRRVGKDGALGAEVPREGVFRLQTPQLCDFDMLLEAMERDANLAAQPDESAVLSAAGHAVRTVPGDPLNVKLTHPEDFATLERLMSETRTGTGFDVHAFGPGDHVMLCGVKVYHDQGLTGHSDADVGLHALTDAVLGAVGAGDIGRHFPPSDERWRGADSALFLKHSLEIAEERGFRPANLDVTLICERPKIGPHAEAMVARIAEITGTSPDRINVKATTTERLGFPGRGEGIAAQAVATMRR